MERENVKKYRIPERKQRGDEVRDRKGVWGGWAREERPWVSGPESKRGRRGGGGGGGIGVRAKGVTKAYE